MENIAENNKSSSDLVQSYTSCESYDNECNECINSDLKYVCDLPVAIQNGIVDKLNGDIISVNNSSNIHVGAKIGKVIVDTFTVVSSTNVQSTPFKHKRKLILGVISSLCLGAAIICIVYFTFFTESELDWYVKRKSWGAKDAKQPCTESEFKKVVEIILFQTNTEFCYNFHDCSQIVRNIQSEDLTDIFATDIKFNFVIGGDGNVYEGLDWHCKGEHVFLPFSALHIGVIGDFSKNRHNNHLSNLQKSAIDKLFEYGIEKEKLYEKFDITPACCYKKISDPGENILNEIVHWPQFVRSCLYSENCDYSSVTDMDALLNITNTDNILLNITNTDNVLLNSTNTNYVSLNSTYTDS